MSPLILAAGRGLSARLLRSGPTRVSVAAAHRLLEQRGLTNAQVLASDGLQAVRDRRFDLVAMNPPFHLGGIQTTALAERFISEAAQALRPRRRFYLVANRFF